MRPQVLMSVRLRLWRVMGYGLVIGVVGYTGFLAAVSGGKGRKNSEIASVQGSRQRIGRLGTITEQLDNGRFILKYDTVTGDENALHLEKVDGTMEQAQETWKVLAPTADRKDKIWTMNGPVRIGARRPSTSSLMGQGEMPDSGPALRWDSGVWRGLSTLHWQDLEGKGRGIWTLPPGWQRDVDGGMTVEKGPVRWKATEPGTLKAMEVDALRLSDGFSSGKLDHVRATLEGGSLQAERAEIDPAWIHWVAPLHFQRDDGWNGEASQGQAPRPVEGQALSQVELKDFKARRNVPNGQERLRSDGARWTQNGIRLEGSVCLEQPLNIGTISLDAPRMLMRQVAGGTDLPAALPPGDIWAEGTAVLSWGRRTLSSPKIEVRYGNRNWHMVAPVHGRSEFGTFTAGEGRGTPERWEFTGPIRGDLSDGGTLRGNRLLWEQARWTLEGGPATLQRFQQRISGPRLVRLGDVSTFPDGLNGTLSGAEGDYVLRADKGEVTPTAVTLTGRVDCRGQGWKLSCGRAVLHLGPGNTVKRITASGAVTLRGSLGEGWGEAIEIDVATRTAKWQGRVRGLAEVQQ
ncbi:hypothetical protein [Holophaga foetida]|uniref:hypothetical protein n=1 Tax=Holophaga foetida TaxID=35839 RepID=UPI0002473AC4|nr:hypothetical protein [Holophaga foetida]